MTIDAAIMAMVIPFWKVINTLLNTIFVCLRNVPRTISIGFTEEINTAGNVCKRSFTKGTAACASNQPIPKEITVSKVDSIIIRMNKSPRDDPNKRLVAISFAR